VAIVLAGSLFFLISAAPDRKSSSSKESIDECCKKKSGVQTDEKSWEHLSRQFFSSI